jgi:N-acetyl-anhydromuramyl-L-alanine amidase AmpD
MSPGVADGTGEGVAAGVGEGVAAADARGVGATVEAGPPQAASTANTRIRARITTRVPRRFPWEMAIQWRGPVPDSNFTVGREGNAITLIVDHWTVVMFEAAIRRFLDPASILSAHYVIGQDGRIAQLVSEADTAYHAGKFDVNLRSIGIEHEAGPAMPPSDALYAASAQLHAEIASRHRLALQVGTTVLPHHAIVPTECPGTLDLDRIVRDALNTQQEDDMFTDADRAKLDRIYQHLEAYEPLTWTKRLQLWLARAFRTQFPEADLGGPDVETGQPFKG